MARDYIVPFGAVAVTAQQDFFEISPADDIPCEIREIHLSQSTEVGDAQEEGLRLSVVRGFTSSGTGGTAPTPTPVDSRDSAAGFAAEVNNTTKANTGTTTVLGEFNWNVRAPFDWIYPEGKGPRCDQAQSRIVVVLGTTPADSITMSGYLVVREL